MTPCASPLVSVIITNYNYARYLPCAIESALGQTYPRVEVVVVDDGSTDDSRAVIAAYGERVIPVLRPNSWQAAACNAGFAAARGDIVLFLDADDTLQPAILERVAAAFASNPGAAKAQFRLADIDADGRPTGGTRPRAGRRMPSGDLARRVAAGRGYLSPPTSGNAFPAWVLRRVLPLPEARDGMWPDAYLARASAMLGPVISLAEVGGCYRAHGANHYDATGLDLDWVRADIERATRGHEPLRRLARATGVRGYPEQPAGLRDVNLLALRMISRKLDPARHPLPDDRPRSLALAGARAAASDPDRDWARRARFVAWFALLPLLPRAVAARAAAALLFPSAGGRPARLRPRVAYLSPTYHPYRVPLFDALHRRLAGGLTVVTLATQDTKNDRLAQAKGHFQRRTVSGRYLRLARGYEAGQQTPTGLLATPSFPFVLLRLRPRLVISNNFNLWTLITLALRFPTIIFWEGTAHTERTVGARRAWTRRWMARRARGFVVNGSQSRAYLVDRVGVPERLIVEGGMCAEQPPKAFGEPGPRRVAPGEAARFVFVGRLVAGKGVDCLLRAAACLRASGHRQFEITAVGEGPELDSLTQLAEELGVSEHVHFCGYVPPDGVWDVYARQHVFVLPTLQDTWALVVPEAMSLGLPVLVSRYAGSAADLVEEGGNGHVFDPADHARLAELMRGYIDEPERVARHGARSLELVAPYTPERCAEVYLAAIRRCAGRG